MSGGSENFFIEAILYLFLELNNKMVEYFLTTTFSKA